MKYLFTLFTIIVGGNTAIFAQPTFSKDIAPIVFNHCTSCHRAGEIGPMPLTNYTEIKNWSYTIKYVTSQRIMPPWKADTHYSTFLDQNYLNDTQIQTISDWVDAGAPIGVESEIPPLPYFPPNSLLGTPDLVLSFAKSYKHVGNGKDEYRYFVLPTGLTENKKLKAIEMRPGNKKIVHHALFFADPSGKSRQYDEQTPEYGFSPDDNADFDVFEVINRDQFPGYVPGQKPRYFPDGLAQTVPANSDLVMQIHYAPSPTDEIDSSTVNIFFAKDDEIIYRNVQDYIMLPFNLVTGTNSFFMLPNTVKKFEGVYTVPFDVSLVGIFPHMHLLGQNWEVYIENPDGTKTNLIKINDWDFNWQGGYYFDRYKIAKKGSKIHAFATYDNTTNNPVNPNNPPKFVTWGEGTKDEMYYLPLLYVPYRSGDENVVFGNEVSSTTVASPTSPLQLSLYPNPILEGSNNDVALNFSLERGQPVSIDIIDQNGSFVRKVRNSEYFGNGNHIIHIQTQNLTAGYYFIQVNSLDNKATVPLIIK